MPLAIAATAAIIITAIMMTNNYIGDAKSGKEGGSGEGARR